MHNVRCARELVLPTLYPFRRLRPDGHSLLPILPDEGYIGAGIGVRVSQRRLSGGQVLNRTARTYTRFHAALRAPSERANARLQQRHALNHLGEVLTRAVRQFADDVAEGTFPGPERSF